MAQAELEYLIKTKSENSGVASHTQAVREETRAIDDQNRALKENNALAAKAGGLATAPVLGGETSSAAAITTEREYKQAVKLIEGYNNLLTAKRLVGLEDEALVERIKLLDAALSEERALIIAENIEERALAETRAKANAELAAQMSSGAAAAKAQRLKDEAQASRLAARAVKEQVQAEQELAQAYAKEVDAQIKAENATRAGGGGHGGRGVFGGMVGASRELRSALVPLNYMLPHIANEVASQLIYGFNASTIAIAAGAVALTEYYTHAKEFAKFVDTLDETNKGFSESFEKQRAVVVDDRAELAKFEEQLRLVRNETATATQFTEQLIHKYQTLARLTDGVFKAKEGLDKAIVEATTDDEIVKAEKLLAVEVKYAEMQRKRQDAEDKYLLSRQAELVLAEQVASRDAQAARERFEPQKEAADKAAAKAATDYATVNQQLEKAQQKQKAVQDRRDAIPGITIGGVLYPFTRSGYDEAVITAQLWQSYQGEIDKLNKMRTSLGDPNNPQGVAATKAAKESTDAQAARFEEEAKAAAKRANDAQRKFEEDRGTAEAKAAGRYFDNLNEKATGYVKIIEEVEKKMRELDKENEKADASGQAKVRIEEAKLEAQLQTNLRLYQQVKAQLGGAAPVLYPGDNPYTEQDVENGPMNRPLRAAPRPAEVRVPRDRNFTSDGTGWDDDSEVGRLLHRIDTKIGNNDDAGAAALLQAFEQKHAKEESLILAVIRKLNEQGERHAQLQAQVQTNN